MPTTRPLPIRAAAWVLALGVCCPALADDDGLATLEPVLAAAQAPLQVPAPAPVALRSAGTGMASWFGPGFHGKPTASGERFDMHDLTAAHKTLPFGSRVLVRNLDNQKEIEVRINDHGPHARGRVIDLSRAAAAALGMLERGVARVELLLLPSPAAQDTARPTRKAR